MDVTNEINHVYVLNNDCEAQLTFIYKFIGDCIYDSGEIERVDHFIENLDVIRISLPASLSVLTATLSIKNKLKYRNALYQKISDFILSNEEHKKDHVLLLKGLG